MLLIWGSYARNQPLPSLGWTCPHCQTASYHDVRRDYRVGHLFFWPLFPFGDVFSSACQTCGHAQVIARPAGALPALPFLHRLGFAIPLAAIVGVPLLLMMLGSVAALASSGARASGARATSTAASDDARLSTLEARLVAGKAFGEGAEAQRIASAVHTTLVKDGQLPAREVSVAVQLVAGAPRHVVVVAQVKRLKDESAFERRFLVDAVHDALEDALEPTDEVTFGMKGTLLYGAVATGPAVGEWSTQIDSVASTEPLVRALAARGATSKEAATVKAATAGP